MWAAGFLPTLPAASKIRSSRRFEPVQPGWSDGEDSRPKSIIGKYGQVRQRGV
jgi:hypothetical protein